jgi:parvulin-like peptidyl-prolyl isomerase
VTRRLVLAAAGLAASAVLTSCSSVTPPAATVNGEEISMSDFDELASAFSVSNAVSAELPDPLADDVVDGASARELLTYMIQSEVLRQELVEAGGRIDDGEVNAQAAEFEASDPEGWAALPEPLQRLYSERPVLIDRFTALIAPPAEETEAAYGLGIETSNIACVSHILLATEAEAEAASARIEDGETFAEVAQDVGTDGTAPNGGALTNPESGAACTDGATFVSSYDQTFVTAALDAEVGVPTAPIETSFGFHLILVRPFSEVADEVLAAAQQAALAAQAADLFDGLEVSVSPAIGTWSSATNSVQSLGSSSG